MKRIKLFLVASLIMTLSCGRRADFSGFQNISAVNTLAITNEELADRLDYSVEYIPLETTDESIIGSVMSTSVTDNHIFVLSSNMNSEELLVFDSKGAFLNKVGAHGRAQNEYLKIKTFAVDRIGKQVVIVDSNKQQFLIYNFSGRYISATDGDDKMKFISKMEQMDDGSFLVSYGVHFKNEEKPNPLFAQYSPDLSEYKELATTELYAMGDYSYSIMPFSSDGEEALCVEPLSNTISLLSSDGVYAPVCDVTLPGGNKPITTGDFAEHFASMGKYISRIFSFKNHTIIVYLGSTILFDNEEKEGYLLDNSYELAKFNKFPLILSNIMFSDGVSLYCYLSSTTAMDYYETIDVDDEFKMLAKDLDGDSNPILLKFDLAGFSN